MKNILIKLKSNKGFTLLELIVVVGVIAIISTVVMTALDPMAQFQKANDSKIKSDLAQLQRIFESYYSDNGRYPASASCTNADGTFNYVPQKISDALDGACWGDPWTPYMDFLPKSSGYPNRSYVYYSPDGQSYYLYANLERGEQDPQSCDSGNACGNVPPDASCGGVCNYGVTSPNVNP